MHQFIHESIPGWSVGRFYRNRRVFNVLTLKTNIDITVHGYFGAARCLTRSAGYPPQLEQKHKYKVQLSHDLGNKVQNVEIAQE